MENGCKNQAVLLRSLFEREKAKKFEPGLLNKIVIADSYAYTALRLAIGINDAKAHEESKGGRSGAGLHVGLKFSIKIGVRGPGFERTRRGYKSF